MSAGKHLDISSSTPNNKPLPDGVSKTYDVTSKWSPGWGSTNELPEMLSILATLKHRQQQRGDQGQIQRTENLERKIDAIIQHFKIKLPDELDIDQAPGAMSMKRY